jgi:glycosyltransferase involved in cell wall biosynthesis
LLTALNSRQKYRIAIDARMINHSGIGRYIRNLLEQYRQIAPPGMEFILIGNRELLESYASGDAFKIYHYPPGIYGIGEQLRFYELQKLGVDLFHVPHYNVPVFYQGKMIVTIHDLIHFLYPETISKRLGRRYSNYLLNQALHKASAILTHTQSVKNEILCHFPVPEQRIHPVYPGSDHLAKIPLAVDSKSILEHFHISSPYFLYVGIDKPHKNLKYLQDAFNYFQKTINDSYSLVFTGPMEKNSLSSRIVYTGTVSDRELKVLYRNATSLILPSLSEGFGFSAVESLEEGIPVLASDIPTLHEVLENHALYFNPFDIMSVVNTMKTIIDNPMNRSNLTRYAGKYTWKKTAEQVLNLYTESIQSH